ncbi:hypothetical protein ACEUD2_03170 [Aeromonas veronii]|uniref:hypothetical protein n=1 Tax=Aeromonas veronii TaxID=654 RepID=UPI00191F2E13|nr:hypothetical protein [Aeromonas veronii]MBL0495302.1 hypothetical protein [Aeromonas veronii]
MKKNQLKLYSLLFVSHLIVADTVFAKESLPTPDVVGHKPTVDNVRLDKVTAVTGDTLNILYDYHDIDGDIDASTIKWLYNGVEAPGETGSSYKPQLNVFTPKGVPCTSFQITAEVTARSQSGDPFIGETKQIVPIQVALQRPTTGIEFTFPSLVPMRFRQAEAFCKAKGMQLPTGSQLVDLFTPFKGYTKVSDRLLASNMTMALGWPTDYYCGGTYGYSNYWARQVNNQAAFVLPGTDIKIKYVDPDPQDPNIQPQEGLVTCVPGP